MTDWNLQAADNAGEQINTFRAGLEKELRQILGDGANVIYRNDLGMNGLFHLTATIRMNGSRIAPTIDLGEFLDAYRRGISIAVIAENIAGCLPPAEEDGGFDPDEWEDYSRVRTRLAVKLIHAEKNRMLLKEVPYAKILDLALLAVYIVDRSEHSHATITIRNTHLERWGIGRDKLLRDALRSSPLVMPAVVRSIDEALSSAAGSISGNLMQEAFCRPPAAEETEEGAASLFVLSNVFGYLGASAAVYPGTLKSFADAAGRDLFVLPSSVHEVLLLPDSGENEPEGLSEIVREINRTAVAPEEVLSDHVYYFSRERGLILPGDRISPDK